jgi:hypothetical protein
MGARDTLIDELRRQAAAAVEQGFRGVKMKVAHGSLEEDVERISAVRAEIGRDVVHQWLIDSREDATLQQQRHDVFRFDSEFFSKFFDRGTLDQAHFFQLA